MNYPLILNLSDNTDTVTNEPNFETYASIYLYYYASKNTALLSLSLFLPLVHFFLVVFDLDEAALAIASLVFFYPYVGCFPYNKCLTIP